MVTVVVTACASLSCARCGEVSAVHAKQARNGGPRTRWGQTHCYMVAAPHAAPNAVHDGPAQCQARLGRQWWQHQTQYTESLPRCQASRCQASPSSQSEPSIRCQATVKATALSSKVWAVTPVQPPLWGLPSRSMCMPASHCDRHTHRSQIKRCRQSGLSSRAHAAASLVAREGRTRLALLLSHEPSPVTIKQ
jgi:hypothetical protein